MADVMGDTAGIGLIIYGGNREELQAKLRARDDRITELEAALRTIFKMPKGEQHAQVDRRAMVQIAGAALGIIKPNSTV